ncbi:PREDICTED: E3 ubiquitin-protein ligase UBR4-like [Priapulus caudatus]|uniref:E3 ubiquitin-protein ligase UBR4-like n=1 Tax=Priapulus caudatus TaxID=37621 RepID=A0ABM1EQA5_PRICU|nr:PREDICTED: E3 ubiquitin-protein ligase UBR4-like [Priapulus caudatus]
MSPFFLRQYVKGHANDVFEAYPQLLTEMVLRLPYQMKKIADSVPSVTTPVFDQAWFYYLCEYMMTQQTPFVRRQVRKLLLFICGSKDKHRQLRDLHALESHMKNVKVLCAQGGFDFNTSSACSAISLTYDNLISLIEHLKACADIASTRTSNWQKFCQKDESVLSFLIQVSFLFNEGVYPIVLQLLQCALCGARAAQSAAAAASASGAPSGVSRSSSPAKHSRDRAEKEKSEEADGQKYDEALCISLVQQVNRFVDAAMLSQFLRCFLLDSNSTSVRWQAHALILHIYRNSTLTQQVNLLALMWKIWPELPNYGRKAAQFVDLLGYFALKTPHSEKKANDFVERAVAVLRTQNQLLANHPNANIYNMLSGLVELDGYYLESDPCLVCSNPEVPFAGIKLSSIKVDSRFTTTTQIVKLIGSHVISKVTLRVTDLKRTKMVRTVNFYYNNRSVQAVVELKNKPQMWHRAKKCSLTAGQTELKVEFPLPIVACNLMIEYADFYENFQASAETLQCPRCSASVPSYPGVCNNCGENVFQCHKCRAINYDEKDPFLCNACGFCKYAKFDYNLTAKPCCAVDPIENEEDRKKAISNINSLLEKADRVYKQLVSYRPTLDALLQRVSEHGGEKIPEGDNNETPASSVNRAIQLLAQKYCGECKAAFDDLSKIIQKVLATRKELIEYDRQQLEQSSNAQQGALDSNQMPRVQHVPSCEEKRYSVLSSGRCYGCASAAMEHCITLLRALAINSKTRQILCNQGLIGELIDYNLRRGTAQSRGDVRQLLCLLTKDNARATDELNGVLMRRIAGALRTHRNMPDVAASVRHEVTLLAASVQKEDKCWEQRVRCVLRLFLMSVNTHSPVVMENITLPCLKILHHLIKPDAPTSKKNRDRSVESILSVRTASSEVRVDARNWLSHNSQNSFHTWKQLKASEPAVTEPVVVVPAAPSTGKLDKNEARIRYLMEKYGRRWKERTKKLKQAGGLTSMKLLDSAWLRHVIFSPSSRAARQVACNMLEVMCQAPSRKREILDLLTGYLDELGRSGESATEFLALYQRLMKTSHWKNYLARRGVLPHIGNLIIKEIEQLTALEETTLNSDLSLGFALKALTELLASFVEQDTIKQQFKGRLVGVVLNGYLSLRKLIVQRTKLIDETQEKLLELLEEMTTGTESETRGFMVVCVETLSKYGLEDIRTPVYIFERLCSIIYPEENDIGEFFITLEKDLQQEDFLQGRMLGNPYSSLEPGLGPLMRDVKNKICQDCELVALLEDDSGMELLVNNKIISLDLPVKDVYKKTWLPDGEGEAMRIVYRMRGLLGDATEEFIESLDMKKDEAVDNEAVYKMATVMSECGGLESMLKRLAAIKDINRGRPLLVVLLKLVGFCVKVKVNRVRLIDPALNTINIMLGALNQVLLVEQADSATLAEQLLTVMETILAEASAQHGDSFKAFARYCGDKNQLTLLLDRINSGFIRQNHAVLQGLMRLIPFLTFRDDEKMNTLISHFKHYCDFNKFDCEHTPDESVHLDCFCVIASSIECNDNGTHLKDLILVSGIVRSAVDYILLHAAPSKADSVIISDSPEWKEFIGKPALPLILRLLTGLCRGHPPTQLLVAEGLPVIHKLEQVRHSAPGGATRMLDRSFKPFSVYKPYLLFVGMIDLLYKTMLKVSVREGSDWPTSVAEYIRQGDAVLLEAADTVLTTFQEEMLPCESCTEFYDVLGVLGDISDTFMADLFASMPAQ